ncbi:MAG: acyl-CoA thioesterase [Bacteroidetes bacterium]|nr:acyl-CoA thioesterase [Bacteroidota bacterium]
MKISTPVQIRFSDVDLGQHVHNAAYLHYFELGRMEFLRSLVEKDHDWRKLGLILARNEVDYRLPIHLADRISVETRCTKLGTKSFDLGYAVVSAGLDGSRRLHAEGHSVMVCFDYTSQRSIPVPEAWRTALARYLENDGTR